MPAISSTSNKPVAAEKKIHRKKKIRVRNAKVRPAPVHQPGPMTDAEHRRVERNRGTPKYQAAVRSARKHGPATQRGKRIGPAPMSDAETRKGQDYVRKQYLRYVKGDTRRLAPDRNFYKKGTTVPPDIKARHEKRAILKSDATVSAPVLKALEQTTRPIHALAGAEVAAIRELQTHRGLPNPVKVGKAGLRGLQNKDKKGTREVLSQLGVKNKTVLAAGGFAGDVVGDPLTYVSGGTLSLARKAALKDAERVATKTAGKTTAARAATTKKEANRAALRSQGGGADAPSLAERAGRRAQRTGDQSKGVVVRFGGKEVPGVTRATAKAAAPVRKVKNRASRSRGGVAARHVAADVNPNAAPAGVSRQVSDKAVQATRTARAKSNRGQRAAVNLAHAIRTKIGEENYRRVVDAIEAGKIKDLPPALRDDAKRLADQFKHIRRVQRRAGVRVGEIGRKRRIKVPQVTADVEQSAKDLAKARRARASAERAHRAVMRSEGIAQGRAEVLSRSVGGRRAERAAERGKRYAAGGLGVQQTSDALRQSAERVAAAREAAARAEARHGTVKEAAQQQRLARVRALKRKAGQDRGPRGYVPRQIVEAVTDEAAKGKPGVGRRVIKPKSSKARTEKRRLADVRDEKPGLYREDLHALAADRLAEGATSAARAGLNRELANLGDPVKRGAGISLGDGEAVFHVKGSDIREVTDPKELSRIGRELRPNKAGTKLKGANKQGGRYVVLSKEMVKRSLEGAQPTLQGPGIVHALDKVTVGFKRLAIATPGFHVRNLVGDLNNAYLGQPAHRLPGNMRRASKILRAHGAGEKALRQLKPNEVGNATVKTSKYGNVTYDEVAKQLAERGAFRSGYIAGELRELSKSGGVSGGRVATSVRKGRAKVGQTKPARTLKNAVLAREDLPRLTTAMEALRRGASWDEAAHTVASLHFDYQHLTNFERQIARRAMPFYTWSARNIPLQARKYVTRPGKYANYQKLRENASKTVNADQVDSQTKDMYRKLEQAGVKLPGGWEKYLAEWEQRNAGVPVSWGGQKLTISLGLPLQDLNEAPGAAGLHQLNEYYQKGMSLTGPVPKDVVEYFENHSFFFRDEIERQHSPLVAAPGYVGKLPSALRGKLGVTKMVDKKSGKMVWAWPGKMDYLAKAIPGTPNYAQQLATGGTDRRGKTTTGKVLAYMGVKAVPIDATRNAVNLAYARMDEIAKRKSALNQQGFNADHPNREYTKLLAQEKILRGIAFRGKAAQGYKVLPKQGGPPKIRASRSSSTVPPPGRVLNLGGSSSSSGTSGGRVLNLGGSSSSGSTSSGGGRVLNIP